MTMSRNTEIEAEAIRKAAIINATPEVKTVDTSIWCGCGHVVANAYRSSAPTMPPAMRANGRD
jgi:hypothetical protein